MKLYRGKDCVEVFCDYIDKEIKRLYNMFPENPMDELTKEEWSEYNKSKQCHICLHKFDKDDVKVRDHCHYTGKYRVCST